MAKKLNFQQLFVHSSVSHDSSECDEHDAYTVYADLVLTNIKSLG